MIESQGTKFNSSQANPARPEPITDVSNRLFSDEHKSSLTLSSYPVKNRNRQSFIFEKIISVKDIITKGMSSLNTEQKFLRPVTQTYLVVPAAQKILHNLYKLV